MVHNHITTIIKGQQWFHKWDGNQLQPDQRRLPHHEVWLEIKTVEAAANAIKMMIVRGAPAIAITAAYGMTLAVKSG